MIHTDASKTHLRVLISQQGKHISIYSQKLTPAHIYDTTTERELLNIVGTLKEFCTIILGHRITVYDDLKNLTYGNYIS